MKLLRFIYLSLLIITFLNANNALAQDTTALEDGVAAFQASEFPQARQIFEELAIAGNKYAQFNLGLMYDLGQGVEKSDTEALKWYQMSAEQDYVNAQLNVGIFYNIGRGVEQSYEDAVYWFRKAAELGNAQAQFNLGTMYHGGKGVEQSLEDAILWFRIAASKGDQSAINALEQLGVDQ